MAARDIIQAAAGAAGATEANYIEDVFSTHLYTGTGASQTITNGIDLATKGGLVWIKCRSFDRNHELQDTLRGAGYRLQSNLTNSTSFTSGTISSFNSNGFTLGGTNTNYIASGDTFASWTFRKQPKFFDVVTWTGNGTGNRQIAHALGATPGMIICKRTDASGNWVVYHKSFNENLYLNTTDAAGTVGGLFQISGNSTSTNIVLGSNSSETNASGATYVAYLFADSNAGGFGPAGTDSVVACGSFSGQGQINLGWEPQYILVKPYSQTWAWNIIDTMRGAPQSSSGANQLNANTSGAEALGSAIYPTATGFYNDTFGSTYPCIYLAIRRGPMKTPTDATKVFGIDTFTGSNAATTRTYSFSPDMTISRDVGSASSSSNRVLDRMRGWSGASQVNLATNLTNAEFSGQDRTDGTVVSNGLRLYGYSTGNNWLLYFKRAPGFFDVVCFTGTGVATTQAHNLGVVPEFIIVKRRNNASATGWAVYAPPYNQTGTTWLNQSGGLGLIGSALWNSTAPTNSVFTVGTYEDVNASGSTYVAYLFATCPGVSKVFSFTGNGSSQTIDCGFTSGARFVLIKRTDSTGDWYVWDTARGIVAGNDPHLSLNSSAAEVTSNDTIDPASSGFIVNQVAATNVNVNNATYIGLAIA